jgi:hypothetical protein
MNMNYESLRLDLEEAREAIDHVLMEISPGGYYEIPDADSEEALVTEFWHIYHHLNLAWNRRHVFTESEMRANRKEHSSFPKDIAAKIDEFNEIELD